MLTAHANAMSYLHLTSLHIFKSIVVMIWLWCSQIPLLPELYDAVNVKLLMLKFYNFIKCIVNKLYSIITKNAMGSTKNTYPLFDKHFHRISLVFNNDTIAKSTKLIKYV